jgi:hypothetical protein
VTLLLSVTALLLPLQEKVLHQKLHLFITPSVERFWDLEILLIGQTLFLALRCQGKAVLLATTTCLLPHPRPHLVDHSLIMKMYLPQIVLHIWM